MRLHFWSGTKHFVTCTKRHKNNSKLTYLAVSDDCWPDLLEPKIKNYYRGSGSILIQEQIIQMQID